MIEKMDSKWLPLATASILGQAPSHQALVLKLQRIRALGVVRVQHDTIHRAHNLALRFVKVTHALRAQVPGNLINFLTLIDCIVGTLGLAHITINTFIVDQ